LTGVGINPDTGVKAIYAGSHSASFEALRNHKVEAGELNSQQIVSATQAGSYKPGMFVELWRSQPIPLDPIAIAPSIKNPFRAHLISVLQNLNLGKRRRPISRSSAVRGPGSSRKRTVLMT
jgi:phosphonate transport system substrate-binding protein